MGGPIVRSGATPEFSKGWEKIFGKKKTASRGAPPKVANKSKKLKKPKKTAKK